HRGHVEEVVMEDGHQPPRIPVAYVVVVETRNLFTGHVTDAAAPAHAPLERGESAVRQLLAPVPARVVEQVEVITRERERHAVRQRARGEERRVVRLAVERDQALEATRLRSTSPRSRSCT